MFEHHQYINSLPVHKNERSMSKDIHCPFQLRFFQSNDNCISNNIVCFSDNFFCRSPNSLVSNLDGSYSNDGDSEASLQEGYSDTDNEQQDGQDGIRGRVAIFRERTKSIFIEKCVRFRFTDMFVF